MDVPVGLQREMNKAISGIHQSREPLARARRVGQLMNYLQSMTTELAQIRRNALAEAVQWPGASIASVATELGLSKSAIAKLVTPDLRVGMAKDLRSRLAKGYNPPPQR